MLPFKKTSTTLLLTTLSVTYSQIALADHGSLGFGIGTASPIITQTGVTLPAGIITQFVSIDSASDAQLLNIKNNTIDDAHGDIHSVETFLQPAVFAAYGVTDDLTVGMRLPYVVCTMSSTALKAKYRMTANATMDAYALTRFLRCHCRTARCVNGNAKRWSIFAPASC